MIAQWWLVLGIVLLGLAVAGGFALLSADQYRGRSLLMVISEDGDGSSESVARGLARAYSLLVTDPVVLNRLPDDRLAGTPPAEIADDVGVNLTADAPIMEVTARASKPQSAADLANDMADAVTALSLDHAPITGYRLVILSIAEAPYEPTSPSLVLSLALGGVFAILVAVVVVSALGSRSDGGTRAVRGTESGDA